MPEAAPHTEFEGPEFKDFKDRKPKAMKPAAVCTSCGKSITLYTHYKAVVPHPILDVLMCRKCHGFYHSGRITQDDDGLDEQCKWCGEGGELLVCDFCTHAFCEHCIKRNFTSKYLQKIRRLQKWHCFACDAKPLRKKVEECKRVMQRFYNHSLEHECLFPHYLNENNKTIDAILSPLENAEHDPPRKCSSDQGPSHITPLTILRESESYKVLANNSKSTINTKSDSEYKEKIPPKDRNSDSQVQDGICSKVDEKTEQETNTPEDMGSFLTKNSMEQKDGSIEQEIEDKILNEESTEAVESVDNDLDCDSEKKGDDMDQTTYSAAISSPRTPSSEEKFQKAESMLSNFQHLIDEWDSDMKSKSETWSRPYHQYKSTSILLKKIKKIKLTVEKIENDLKGKKKRFRNNRPSLGSASSSDDESPTKIENRRSSNEKKRISTESSKKETLPSPDPYPPSSETLADPVKRSIQKDLVNCEVRVPLKKLTQDEIRKFSRKYSSSTTMMNSSSEYESGSNEDTDTDSSKAVFRRSKNSRKKKSSASDRKPSMPMPDPSSDSNSTAVSDDMNDSDYFDPSQDHYSRWTAADGLCPDNDIAKNLLLQKMKDSSARKDETDSDLDELLEDEKKVDVNSDKIAETKIKASDESGDSGSAGSTDKKNDGKKSYIHPLLKEKITSPSKKNRESFLPSKRKNESSEENNDTKLPKVIKTEQNSVPYDGTTIDVDTDLSTDNDSDEYKPTLRKRDKRSIVLSSDSDLESKKKPKNEDSESDVAGENSSADENITNANTSDDNSTENENIETVEVPKKKRRRVITYDSDEEKPSTDVKKEIQSENEEDSVMFDTPSKRLGRRNIRKIQREETLSQLTRQARREELLRRQRLEENREIEEKEVIVITDDENQSPAKKTITVCMVLSRNPLVQVDPLLVRELKPHQLEGVRFLWDNLIERVAAVDTKPGGGCILAHCMGLGKTLQAITFLHTVLTSMHLKTLKTALILCPYGTVLNWKHEFNLWLSKCENEKRIKIFELSSKKNIHDRIRTLEKWSKYGGVIIMGYGLFRTIMSEKNRSTRQQKEIYQRCLHSPGPDMFICDEGHILKNANSSIAQLVRQLKTKRRIILTGTPLQNNMVEYHCMVSIVKPQLLGNLKEFKNRFINPIENGQHVDSTPGDFKLMKKRAHVLHEMLAGCVQRKDYTCLRAHLNPKYEYVLNVRLSDLQIRLYKSYLGWISNDIKLRKSCLFSDFNIFLLLACHPACLALAKIRREDKENEEDKRNFVNDDESEESSGEDEESSDSVTVISDEEGLTQDSSFPRTVEDLYAMSVKKLQHYINKNTSPNNVTTKNRKKLVHLATKCMNQFMNNPEKVAEYLNEKSIKELKKIILERGGNLAGCAEKCDLVFKAKSLMDEKSQDEKEWFEELIPQQRNLANANSHSGKILLMLAILRGSTEVGDKVVLFSQSLISLDIIENVLKTETENVNKDLVSPVKPYSKWYKNIDYFRLDGSTPSSERNRMIKTFNSSREPRIRLFLVSTRAGGIGINLIGANRAIVFDASWNPTNDVQSIFRIYRFGQKKPCYIYRFIAQGTMEEKIYERQIIKQSLAFRVVDEQQILRHFTARDLAELYSFKPAPKSIVRKDKNGVEIEETPDCAPPKDDILASIIKNISTRDMIVSFHEHDSLLDHQVDEELTDAERRAAWEEYDNEKRKNEEQLAVDVSSKFANIPIDGIRILLAKTQEALAKVTKSYNELPEKSLNDIMIEVQLENRAMSTDDVSEEAVKRYLNQHLAKNNSSQIKRYLEKKFDELKQWSLYKQQERHVSFLTSNPQPQAQSVPRASLPTSSSSSNYYPPYNPTYSTNQNPYTHSQTSSTSAYPRHPNVRTGFTNLPSQPRPQTAGYRPNSAFTQPRYTPSNPRPPNRHPGGYTPFRTQNSGHTNLHTHQYGNMNGFQNSNMNRRTNSPIYNPRK